MKLPSLDIPQTREEKRVTLLFLLSLVVLVLIIAFLIFLERIHESAPVTIEYSQHQTERTNTVFTDVTIEARAAYVLDAATGRVLFSKNAETQLPLASITKLMTAIVAAEQSTKDDVISIDERALLPAGDDGLLAQDTWTLRDLLSFTLVVSSNDGAAAVAHSVEAKTPRTTSDSFIEQMNQRAQELGLIQTYFLNPTGLDATTYTSGGYGSAKDVAHMMLHALAVSGEELEATTKAESQFASKSALTYPAINTNQHVDHIPGLMASKTGFTDLAGGNLVVAFDAGFSRPVIIVVLGSTLDGRFSDVQTLIELSLKDIALQG